MSYDPVRGLSVQSCYLNKNTGNTFGTKKTILQYIPLKKWISHIYPLPPESMVYTGDSYGPFMGRLMNGTWDE